MNQLPDILMPNTVAASLEVSARPEAHNLRPDEVLVGDRADTRRVLVFRGAKLPEVILAVDAVLEEAQTGQQDYDDLRIGALTVFSNVLTAMGTGLEQVRAIRAERTDE